MNRHSFEAYRSKPSVGGEALCPRSSRMHWAVGLLAVGLVSACAGSAEDSGRLAEPFTVAFESPLNLIVVEAKIRNQGPFRFILDSGATATVIDADVAKRVRSKY